MFPGKPLFLPFWVKNTLYVVTKSVLEVFINITLIHRVAKQVSNLNFLRKKNLGGGGSQATTLVLSGGCLVFRET